MTLTVIIPTYNRPDCVRENLARLGEQAVPPEQIIVVDASPNDHTENVVENFPHVLYLCNDSARGNLPHSRNAGLRHATGELIAFLDDDAFVHPGWAENLRATYADEEVAGVAGRALNQQPGEERHGADRIGRFLPDGRTTGFFAADPGGIVTVDHMIGCNMSFRASVLAHLGGFRDDMRPGPFSLCEDTEICTRAGRLGYRFVFNPAVCADHIGAPQTGGRRFSPKYHYYHVKNNLIMIVRNHGAGALAVRHLGGIAAQATREFVRKAGGAVLTFLCTMAGLVSGLVGGIYWLARTGDDPVRRDAAGDAIREQLRHRGAGRPTAVVHGS